MNRVEKWGVFEVELQGRSEGNPYIDYTIVGEFSHDNECKEVLGFYDGDGKYIVRFMPSFIGDYTYRISGSFSDQESTGSFEAVAPSEGNHGPVRVVNECHFAYEDGKPYYSIGTTCYVWTHQSMELQEQTLRTLAASAFNKIRFCVFPKHYDYNFNEPLTYPYVGTPCDSSVLTSDNFGEYTGAAPGNDWDYYRFNPEHFRHFEKRIQDLMNLGIEADIIVMHPYDRWGFSMMPASADDLYWRYVIARFSAYRNVWWSLANEYDILKNKTIADWERYASLICEYDKYNHLRSIHNCIPFYDHNRPWITHCSIQRQDLYKTAEFTDLWRAKYRKPIVLDEIVYEGNIQHGWGNISGKELVRRFWEAMCRGGYAGHGETFYNDDNILWWSHGGVLHGESAERFAFMKQFMDDVPGYGLKPLKMGWDEVVAVEDGTSFTGKYDYYLFYYGFGRPSFRYFELDQNSVFEAEVIDTWNMTIENMGRFQGRFKIELPGREYIAVRLRRVEQ